MGSLYRSQHELLPLFEKGDAPHTKNVELGKRGRWRSNLWTYPGAPSLGSDARRGLQDHPTVKPSAMLEDALLDLTNQATPSLTRSSAPARPSSPPTRLVACARVSRIELDPLYVDVIIRRYETATGNDAVLVETGETFWRLTDRRRREPAAG
jgi:hypothetical protein